MRIANHDDRLVLVDGGRFLDVEAASGGKFSSRISDIYDRWDEFLVWSKTQNLDDAREIRDGAFGPPSPQPPQIFGIGTNYHGYIAAAELPTPTVPLVFTKFRSAISGPDAIVDLSGPKVDWEVELVVVLGRRARRVAAEDAWAHVAGLTIGQDISDREAQMLPESLPQLSLGKSFPNYAPCGPFLVTPDEFENRDRIPLGCSLNGHEVQRSDSGDLIFDVPQLIEYLSAMVTLLPGDLIFTGTPAGVGSVMKPPRFLEPDDVVTSWIEGIGEMTQTFTRSEASAE